MKTCVSLTLCVVFSIERDGAKGSQKCSIFKLPGPDTSPLRVLRSAEICADPLSLSGNCECLRFGRRAKQSRILMHVVSRFPGSLQRLSLEQNQRWLRTFTSSYGKIAGNMEGICSLENRAWWKNFVSDSFGFGSNMVGFLVQLCFLPILAQLQAAASHTTPPVSCSAISRCRLKHSWSVKYERMCMMDSLKKRRSA